MSASHRFLLLLATCLLAFRLAPGAESHPSVAGTTWVSDKEIRGTFSTITFTPDGEYKEEWKKKRHPKGTWTASTDNQRITVTLTGGQVLIFTYNNEKDLVRDVGSQVYKRVSKGPAPAVAAAPAAPVPSPNPAPIVKLTAEQERAVVLIKGDNSVGTGFLIKTAEGPVVVTNLHVIANNPHVTISTNNGAPVTIVSYKGAADRDLAMILLKDGAFHYLEPAADVSAVAQTGDAVITPGNSEGGGVILNTGGKVIGVGPDRVEFDNPVFHGNSGGPVIHVKSGKVIGIVTEGMKVVLTDELDKTSYANRNSAIHGTMRYFGLRLDTVPKWVPFDWAQFQTQTSYLDDFNKRSRSLDAYLNAPDDRKPEDIIWWDDDKIVKANHDVGDPAFWLSEMKTIAQSGVAAMENPDNFYPFEQERAKWELTYRKAILAEIDRINPNAPPANSPGSSSPHGKHHR